MKTSPLILLCLMLLLVGAGMGCGEDIHYPGGGYDYPQNPTAKDTRFYYCPLRDSMSRKDSFSGSLDYFLFTYLHEPNLSIRPYGKDIFRLVYSEALGSLYTITVSEANIVVKTEGPKYKDFEYHVYNQDDISFYNGNSASYHIDPEKYLLWQILHKFPFDTAKISRRGKHITDSLLHLYPQLRDGNYCWNLISAKMAPAMSFTFDSTIIPITKKEFKHIVDMINNSGYWQMPDRINCDSPPMDGWGFSLEANTARKWNYVSFGSCSDDTKMQLSFCKACQEIVKYAKMEKRIGLLYSDSSIMGPIEIAPADTTH